jgi:hypothetical protein
MVILLYAVEIEIVRDVETPNRDEFFTEAAQAYRARGACHLARGEPDAARLDAKRADSLEAEAKKLATRVQTEMINGWTEPLTLLVEGTSYRLEVGQKQVVLTRANPFTYELVTGQHRVSGTLQGGRSYTIRNPSQ